MATSQAHSLKIKICSWNVAPLKESDPLKDSGQKPSEKTADFLNKTLRSIQPHLVLLQQPLCKIRKDCGGTVYKSGGNKHPAKTK